MNKKAIDKKLITGFIIVIVSAIFIILWLPSWSKANEAIVHKQQCKDSIKLSSLAHISQFELKPGQIKCPPIEIKIKGDPGNKRDESSMYYQLAQLMVETWDVFGQGKLNLFESLGVYCSVYAFIDFDKKGKILEGFKDYLSSNTIPSRGVDYIEYLTNGASPDSNLYLSNSKNIVIDTSKKYAMVFIYTRNLTKIDNLVNNLGHAINSLGSGSNIVGGEQAVGTIGAGVIGSAAGGIGIMMLGGGPVTVTLGAVAIGGVAAYSAIFAGERPQLSAYVVLTPYDSQDALKNIGCEQFPVSLGTR